MFSGCSLLTSIDMSNFDTSNVTEMSYMFYGCSSLEKLDLSHFNTPNLVDMEHLFEYCCSLTYIDISNFNANHAKYYNAFEGINDEGIIIFNSTIFPRELLDYIPNNWECNDIGNKTLIINKL